MLKILTIFTMMIMMMIIIIIILMTCYEIMMKIKIWDLDFDWFYIRLLIACHFCTKAGLSVMYWVMIVEWLWQWFFASIPNLSASLLSVEWQGRVQMHRIKVSCKKLHESKNKLHQSKNKSHQSKLQIGTKQITKQCCELQFSEINCSPLVK